MATLKQINESLLVKPGTINEFVLVPVADVSVVTEAKSGQAGKYRAKVGHADKINQNDRIYPRELWAVCIERCKSKIKEGKLTGAVDHPGWSSGALKDTCIKWHSLKMDADGGVFGEFSIITKHSRGADLQSLVDAEVAIGFSTRGVGSARRPTDDEKKRYGLPDDGCCTVIIDDDYDLKKIDSVDDPSVDDAYIEIPPLASASDGVIEPPVTENDMKTLDEMKTQNPALFTLHEAAINAAVDAKLAPVQAELVEAKKKLADSAKTVGLLNGFIDGLKEAPGVTIPFKEVGAKDLTAKIETLTTELTQAKDATKAEQAKVVAKDAEIAKRDAAKLDADRRIAVLEKLDAAIEDSDFAEQITKLVKGVDGKGGMIEGAKFDVAALEAFVEAKTAEYEEIAPKGDLKIRDEKAPPVAGGKKKSLTSEQIRKDFALS